MLPYIWKEVERFILFVTEAHLYQSYRKHKIWPISHSLKSINITKRNNVESIIIKFRLWTIPSLTRNHCVLFYKFEIKLLNFFNGFKLQSICAINLWQSLNPPPKATCFLLLLVTAVIILHVFFENEKFEK